MPVTRRTFTCEQCGVTFTSTITDEQAVAETTALWPNEKPERWALVCSECFDEIMGRSVADN